MLVDAIRGGEYREGDRLPSERELAAQIGVSRAIVSDAIDELEALGVLTSRRGRGGGTFVMSVSKLPARSKRVRGESRQVMEWLLEAREAIEVAVVAGAATRARVTELRELRKLHAEMADLVGDVPAFVEAAVMFNLKVAEASGNPFLYRFTKELVNEQMALRAEFTDDPSPEEFAESLRAHWALLQAISNGEMGQIREAVGEHIQEMRDIYLPAFDEMESDAEDED